MKVPKTFYSNLKPWGVVSFLNPHAYSNYRMSTERDYDYGSSLRLHYNYNYSFTLIEGLPRVFWVKVNS